MTRNPKVTTFSGNKPPYGNLDWWPISMFFNSADPRWDDVRVRRAMGYAMNVEPIVAVASGGASDPSRTPFPNFPPLLPYIHSFDDIVKSNRIGVYDPKESGRLMTDAGYEKDGQNFWAKDGKRAGGDMHGISIVNQLGPLVQQQLRKGGFAVTFYSTPDSGRHHGDRAMSAGVVRPCRQQHLRSIGDLEAYMSKNFAPIGTSDFLFRAPAE